MLESDISNDEDVQRLRNARKTSAVLKLQLANIRSILPDVLILAFEGKDDKTIYYHWIKRVRPDLEYEPFPCDGKEQVLLFREMLERDRGGLGKGIYFCVDRDFDDLRGQSKSEHIFMTDKYAVENYLVTAEVLQDLLKNEYHCHAQIERRQEILELFDQAYAEFLTVTTDLNFRLFVIRKLGLSLKRKLPEKISKLAKVLVHHVEGSGNDVAELVKVELEPAPEKFAEFLNEFRELNPKDRYRGKFSLMFFMKWLEELALDRNSERPQFFSKEANKKVRFQDITLDCLAVKSKLPEGFKEFILAAK